MFVCVSGGKRWRCTEVLIMNDQVEKLATVMVRTHNWRTIPVRKVKTLPTNLHACKGWGA